jgi:sugar lactone lactonase YvrE
LRAGERTRGAPPLAFSCSSSWNCTASASNSFSPEASDGTFRPGSTAGCKTGTARAPYTSRRDLFWTNATRAREDDGDALAAALEVGMNDGGDGALLVDAAEALNGEGPQWDEQRKRLYWVDMRGPSLRAFEPAARRSLCWEMPAWVGCFGLLRDGRVVVALRTGLSVFDPEDGSLRSLAGAPYDQRRFCFNDGGCDRAGHFLVGPMYHPLGPRDCSPAAAKEAPVWRCRIGDGGAEALALAPLAVPPVRTSNGLAFSPDGRTMYHADTPKKTIWACDYDPHDGAVDRHRVFARVDEGGDSGGPDGAAVDRDGFYLCAVFGAGCLLRFDPDGRLERRLPLPARYPTMPAFGDDDLATLYVTSASFPQRAGKTDRNPAAGGLFALPAPVPGLPTSYMNLQKEAFREPDRR